MSSDGVARTLAMSTLSIPAKAGIQLGDSADRPGSLRNWTPASAGVVERVLHRSRLERRDG